MHLYESFLFDFPHPLHAEYATRSPRPAVNSSILFFAHIETLEPDDRRSIISRFLPPVTFKHYGPIAGSEILVEPDHVIAARLDEHIQASKAMIESLCKFAFDFMAIHWVVTGMLAEMRHACEPARVEEWIGLQQERLRQIEAGIPPISDPPPGLTEQTARYLEESINNSRADAELDRGLYNRFCEAVVAKML